MTRHPTHDAFLSSGHSTSSRARNQGRSLPPRLRAADEALRLSPDGWFVVKLRLWVPQAAFPSGLAPERRRLGNGHLVIVSDRSSTSRVRVGPDGSFEVRLDPGGYVVRTMVPKMGALLVHQDSMAVSVGNHAFAHVALSVWIEYP